MAFLSLEPFIPSGKDFTGSKNLFLALGFAISWDSGDYIGFEKDGCRFILQRYDNQSFAENLMINVKITDAEAFWKEVTDKDLVKRFGIRAIPPKEQPYGKEVVVIDLAGVCWHFVQ
ncbi:MAG: bleomycin resistance protein [Flaviaesturariibacter sp.]|nr:bleomycin resistance protein [Flaviaesturariibacter sp.]